MPSKKSTLLDNFLDLCRTPSPSRHERAAANVLAKKIRALGFEPLEDDAGQELGGDCGNLVVKVPGSGKGPRLFIAAHLDTVEGQDSPPANPLIDGEWITREGGGILGADDKTGCAVMLETLSRLAGENRPHGDLVFAFTVSEEIEALGAAKLDPEIYRDLDAGVILDHSKPTEIVVAAPTKVAFRITVHGLAGHAAFPENKINAAFVMAQTLARLPMGRLDEFTTANLGIMRSGTAINIIPDSAYAEYEIRSHRKDVLDFHVKRVIACIEGVVRENRTFRLGGGSGMGGAENNEDGIKIRYSRVDVDVEVSYEGYRISEEAAIVKRLGAAVEKAGLVPDIVSAQGGSDANILNRRGLESVVLGCGMYGAHGSEERANLKDMADAVEILLNLIGDGGRPSRRSKAKD